MNSSTAKKVIVTVFTSATLIGGATAATAAPDQTQDGLVNVAIGDVAILEDVNVGVAAQIAADVGGVEVGPVALLREAVDRSGATRTVCTTDQGSVRLIQD